MEQLSPENVLSAQHGAWLTHPCTVQLIKNLQTHREQFIKTLSLGAGNTSEPEVAFRLHAYGIRTTDAIISMVTSTTKFIEQSKK
jgi:hypothetical protein